MPASQRERSAVNRFRLPALLVVLWAATAVIASQPSGPSRRAPAIEHQRSPRSMILRGDALGGHTSEGQDPGSDEVPSSDKSRYSATWVLQLWPAAGTPHPAFDETLLDHLEILICRDSDGSACDLVDRLSSAEREIFLRGADGDPEDVGDSESGHYSFDWESPRSLVGTRLEIRLLVAGLHVDSFDYVSTSGSIGHFRDIDERKRYGIRLINESGECIIFCIVARSGWDKADYLGFTARCLCDAP